jgi:DNA-binding transcriptional LysR family regulator
VHVTQPSVSHALGRLRRQFADPLFVRTATGLEPTDLALRLYPDVRVGLEVIDSAVSGVSTFDPATSSRAFRVLATDLGEVALLPSVRAADVRTFALPFETPEVEIALYRYRRNPPSPGIEWLAGLVCDVLRR